MTASPEATSKIGQKNRQIILEAAVKAFAQHGFKGTSLKQIADDAHLPKTNVLYYFRSKQILYLAVLEDILQAWNSRFDQATANDDPATTLADYIAEKMATSRTHPFYSKVFAMEVLNGAEHLNSVFLTQHRQWMQGRIAVIDQWIADKKMAALSPEYLLYHIWACTQHYADFSSQISGLKGRNMSKKDFKIATNNLISLILTGCGLTVPEPYRSV